jgi:Ni/Fe-hydrogenase subunit HybB-like protein
MGVAAGLARLLIGLGGTTALSDSTSWGIWIGFDFALIAFSGAAFTMAAVVHIFHLHQFQPVLRPALLAGFLGYTAVLVLLLLDLGRPDRFYNFLLYWNLHSPLFEICCCVLLYTTVLVLEVAPDFLQKFGWTRMRRFVLWLMAPVTVLGVTLSTLHQSTLGTLYLNMPHRVSPLWWTTMLPILFFTSAVMAGLAMAIVAYRTAVRIHNSPEESKVIQGLMVGIGGVAVIYLTVRIGALVSNGELFNLNWAMMTTWLAAIEIVLGAIVPAIICLTPTLRRSSAMQWVAPLLVLAGVLMNRFNATLASQTAPVAGAAYVPSMMEWMSTIGILSMAALAWYVCVRWLVRFDGHEEAH